MRAPRQPRQPRRLSPQTDQNRDGGGELPVKRRPTIEDHVPTAPAPPPSGDDQDETANHSLPTENATSTGVTRGGDLTKPKGPGIGQRAIQLWSSTAERVRERHTRHDETIVIGDSVSLDARRLERRRDLRKIRLKRAGIGVAIIAVVLLISWLLFASPLLRYNYEPSHITGYSEPSIVNKADVEQLVATYDGQALLSLNERSLETDIAAAIPEIEGVTVERNFPRSLSIVITEAVPVACLGTGDDCTAVTEAGDHLEIPQELAIALPRIGAIGSDLDPARAVDEVLSVLGVLSPETRALVGEISVANGDLVTINLADGRTVFWGGLERGDFKAQVLDALVSVPATHYDVSIPDAPVSR